MKIRTCLFILVVLAVSTAAYSQVFKYRDAEGTIHFTDDLSRVPPDQRQSQDFTEPAAQAAEDSMNTPETQDMESGAGENTTSATDTSYALPAEEEPQETMSPDMGDWLASEQTALREEYKSILAEKEEIEKLRQQNVEINIVNQRIIKNNDRITAYQRRLATYNERVKNYNQFLVEQQNQ